MALTNRMDTNTKGKKKMSTDQENWQEVFEASENALKNLRRREISQKEYLRRINEFARELTAPQKADLFGLFWPNLPDYLMRYNVSIVNGYELFPVELFPVSDTV